MHDDFGSIAYSYFGPGSKTINKPKQDFLSHESDLLHWEKSAHLERPGIICGQKKKVLFRACNWKCCCLNTPQLFFLWSMTRNFAIILVQRLSNSKMKKSRSKCLALFVIPFSFRFYSLLFPYCMTIVATSCVTKAARIIEILETVPVTDPISKALEVPAPCALVPNRTPRAMSS